MPNQDLGRRLYFKIDDNRIREAASRGNFNTQNRHSIYVDAGHARDGVAEDRRGRLGLVQRHTTK